MCVRIGNILTDITAVCVYRSADTYSFGTLSSHFGLDVFGIDCPNFLLRHCPKLEILETNLPGKCFDVRP